MSEDRPGLAEGIEAAKRAHLARFSDAPAWDDLGPIIHTVLTERVTAPVEDAYAAIFQAGVVAGRRAEFLETALFIQCPECPAAIHVPLVGVVEGGQEVTARPDTTELWMHLATHGIQGPAGG